MARTDWNASATCLKGINPIGKEEYESTIIPKMRDKFFESAMSFIESSAPVRDGHTGVVLCGFGRDETLPSLVNILLDARFLSYLRAWITRSCELNKLSNSDTENSRIFSFAQSDITSLFIEGISPDFESYILELYEKNTRDYIFELLNRTLSPDQAIVEKAIQKKVLPKLYSKINLEAQNYKIQRLVNPTLTVIGNLPKEEMAKMAESLVEITSLRRKIESPVETVAGPIDVAFISKGDGLIWLKRKHYFDSEINSDFHARKRL